MYTSCCSYSCPSSFLYSQMLEEWLAQKLLVFCPYVLFSSSSGEPLAKVTSDHHCEAHYTSSFTWPLSSLWLLLKDLEDGAAFASAPSVVLSAWATASSVLETWSLVLELELIECFLSISKSLCLKLNLWWYHKSALCLYITSLLRKTTSRCP